MRTPPSGATTEAERRRDDERRQEAAARFDAILRLPPRAEAARRVGRAVNAGEAIAPPATPPASVPETTPHEENEPAALPLCSSNLAPCPVHRRHGSSDAGQSDAGAAALSEAAISQWRVEATAGHGESGPSDDEAHSAFERLADQLKRLCRRNVSSPETWSIVLPLDPDVLPESELRIHASRDWLRLRFATQSSRSVNLISKHMDWLQRQLEDVLGTHRHIDVDLE